MKAREYVADALLDKVAANMRLECPRVTASLLDPSEEQLGAAMQKNFVEYLPKALLDGFMTISQEVAVKGWGCTATKATWWWPPLGVHLQLCLTMALRLFHCPTLRGGPSTP